MSDKTRVRKKAESRRAPTDLLTRQEAADEIGISLSRLAQLRRAGEIRSVKNERTRAIRFAYAEVLRVRDARALTP